MLSLQLPISDVPTSALFLTPGRSHNTNVTVGHPEVNKSSVCFSNSDFHNKICRSHNENVKANFFSSDKRTYSSSVTGSQCCHQYNPVQVCPAVLQDSRPGCLVSSQGDTHTSRRGAVHKHVKIQKEPEVCLYSQLDCTRRVKVHVGRGRRLWWKVHRWGRHLEDLLIEAVCHESVMTDY